MLNHSTTQAAIKMAIYAILALLMMTKLVYGIGSVHDLVLALEGIGFALIAIALYDASRQKSNDPSPELPSNELSLMDVKLRRLED